MMAVVESRVTQDEIKKEPEQTVDREKVQQRLCNIAGCKHKKYNTIRDSIYIESYVYN